MLLYRDTPSLFVFLREGGREMKKRKIKSLLGEKYSQKRSSFKHFFERNTEILPQNVKYQKDL